MDEKNIVDNKKFWKTVKPLLSGKSVSREKIILAENKKVFTSKYETAETFDFFPNIVKKLNIANFNSNNSVRENIIDPVFKAILKYKNHSIILAIQKYIKKKTLHFEEVNIGEVKKEILKLDKTKASQKNNIPTKIIKENIDIYVDFLCMSINSAIKSSCFLSSLKLADVTHVHKNWRKDMKENFSLVSLLPTLPKTFEKFMFAQMSVLFTSIFSNQQYSFRKGHSTQHFLLVMLKNGSGL